MSRASVLAQNDQAVQELVLRGTPPRFDQSGALATTESLRLRGLEFGGFFAFTAALVGAVDHIGGLVHAYGGGPASYSIPNADTNDVPPGGTIRLQNWTSVNLLLTIQGADKMQESLAIPASSANRNLPPDTYVDITYIGDGIWLLLGTGVVGRTLPFDALLAPQGYQRLPSGLILQCGTTAVATAGDLVHALPFAFPTQFFQVLVTQAYTPGSGSIGYAGASPTSLGSFTWRGSAVANGFTFFALGK